MGAFFKMVVGKNEWANDVKSLSLLLAYKNKIGFTGQLLIEPKPKEPTKHQYDYGNKD